MGRIWYKEEEQVLELEVSTRLRILKNICDRLSKMKVQRKMRMGGGVGLEYPREAGMNAKTSIQRSSQARSGLRRVN